MSPDYVCRSQVWDDATVNTQDVPGMVDPGSFGTRRGGNRPIEVGLVDPAWTRLAVASVVPVLLAISAALPAWVRLIVVVLLVPLTGQGWPALVRTRHDQDATAVITLTGLCAAVLVAITNDFGMAGVVMAFSVPAAFLAQMARRDGRPHLVEDLSSTVTGNLVMISGAGWCALRSGIADPAVIVPCTLALFTGALLTTLNVRATVLEVLTFTLPALVAGASGGALAMVGFFGASHVGAEPALQSAAACLVAGFVAGVLMAVSNRVLWTHRWVPGGRAAVASAIVPILSLGAPVYAIARIMGGFIAG
ncbi:tellurium resistance protein TerC [Actinomyces sp. 432]|nr:MULTISPECIES: tellurium resistance protein TerC [unclassified Actinomyces]NDR53269.1 tellurium resistance protein TerC [Actinomyces sp. 565]QHO91804.1 tellurium resistance protein TerC [Actinomyces sp. 432]